EREVGDGNDGTWVAHPGLIATAKEVFDAHMPGPNQIERKRDDIEVSAADLLQVPNGDITEAGLRQNLNVGIYYLAAWLSGNGCVPLYNLMEDAATAEISRSQLWQWIRHGARLKDGRLIDMALFRAVMGEELEKIRTATGDDGFASGHFEDAAELFERMSAAETFPEFLTLPAYEMMLSAS
ncbi:MAG: malate synthase A, partial [Proteobacteria bacterium]|nr:malate synthase A [Pseudomonadota bacterium]